MSRHKPIGGGFISDVGSDNSIPTVTNPPHNPASILYLKVGYTVNPDGTIAPGYTYFDISGTYPLSGGLHNFINSIRAGGPDISTRTSPLPSDDPTITGPCFVLFSIPFDGAAQFSTTLAPIQTDDTMDQAYFNVQSAPDSILHPSQSHIAYMQATSPSSRGLDHFNLNVDVALSGGGTMPGTIDPAIKNTGHIGSLRGVGDGTHASILAPGV
jgi:hypothetical protein